MTEPQAGSDLGLLTTKAQPQPDGIQRITGNKMNVTLSDDNRIGDHIWYVSDLSHFKEHYPGWQPRYGIEETLVQIFEEFKRRLA